MIQTCAACGRRNRVPARHLAGTVRCGACRAALAPVTAPIDVDAPLFDEIVRKAPVPVLVDFWASWCRPCQAAAPIVRELAREMAGRALVLKVDTEAHPALAARFGVRSIPNFAVLRDGRTVLQHAGVAPAAEMKRWIEQAAGPTARG